MKILGQGHKGIVIADGKKAVKKFYLSVTEWEREKTHLAFLEELQDQGFSIGCTIPKLLKSVGQGTWEIDGKLYRFCNQIEYIPGANANQSITDFTHKKLEVLGKDLGKIAFAMHFSSKAYTDPWKRTFGKKGSLLDHILKDKAAQVTREASEQGTKKAVSLAASYLADKRELLATEATLSHLDFTLSNTQVDVDGHVMGLVDWGSFGLTNPSLSLYQLAPTPIWPYAKQEYENRGGVIRKDILFAAATIHLAWAPIICQKLGFPLDIDETQRNFKIMYENFRSCSF